MKLWLKILLIVIILFLLIFAVLELTEEKEKEENENTAYDYGVYSDNLMTTAEYEAIMRENNDKS